VTFPAFKAAFTILSTIARMRIPDDADQRSGMMPITIPF
jgi:hypothetical protein